MSGSEQGVIEEFRSEIDPIVFAFGALLTAGVIVAFFVNETLVTETIGTAYNWVVTYLNWALLVIVFLIVVFLLFLIVGPWGSIKMGDADPEYSFLSFFAMLYSAGFAAGVVFWGPTEA
ncbi:MAG: BCCT family transporter, partial [Halobacteriota archaeon]